MSLHRFGVSHLVSFALPTFVVMGALTRGRCGDSVLFRNKGFVMLYF